jgi:outer membrane receptor protein involved in Fe transport
MKLIAFVLAGMAVLGAAVWVGAGTTGIISGVVKSDDGKPISGANIIVTGTKLTTVTDANGYYVITNVPPGDYDVRAEMVGYANASADRAQVTMDATSAVNFDMKQEAIKETTAVVTRPRPMIAAEQVNTLNLVTASQENLTRTDPTSVNTVPGVLSTLPGVVVEPNGTGLTHIRGGKPEQIGYYIEGIPVTDPNLGTFSDNLFSTGVSKFQVYTGGFGAEYGNALGCVMNEVKKTGDASPGLRTTVYGGGGDYRNGIAEVGGGSPGGFSYYASSILQRNDFSGTPVLASQTYDDSMAKLVWPSKNDTITVLALQGTLQGELGTAFPVSGDFMRQRYAITGAVWSHNFNSRSFLTIRPYYIHVNALQSMVNSGEVFFGGPFWLEDTSDQSGLTLGYTNQLNDRNLLKFGGSVLKSNNNQFTNIVVPFSNADVNTLQSALYAEEQLKLAKNVTMNAGARYEGITYDRKGLAYVSDDEDYDGAPVPDATASALMPRLGVSYAQDARTAWKISWGKYMKFVPANSVQTIYTDPTNEESQAGLGSTAPQRATAGDISFEKQISDAMAYRITPFYSNYSHLGSLAPDEHGVLRYMDLGKAESRGVEFSLRRKMSSNWQGWLSYTYATIKADNTGTGPLTYTSWDRRHTVSLVADYRKGNWAHTLRTDLGSGLADVYPTAPAARRAGPYAVFTYGLTFHLPKGSGLGDSLNLGIYNIFNNRQVAEYQNGTADSAGGFTTGERSVSMGLSKGF